MSVYRVRNGLVSAPRFVQVDHRGALAVVAHARHQILVPSARCGSEVLAGVTQVMEVQAGSALGKQLPERQIDIDAVSLVIQDGPERA